MSKFLPFDDQVSSGDGLFFYDEVTATKVRFDRQPTLDRPKPSDAAFRFDVDYGSGYYGDLGSGNFHLMPDGKWCLEGSDPDISFKRMSLTLDHALEAWELALGCLEYKAAKERRARHTKKEED